MKEKIKEAMTSLKKTFGEDSISLGEESKKIEAIPTGSIGLDKALGIGGVPKGRIIEIFGPESTGKTTIAYHIIAEAQKKGDTCVFIDAEHSLDEDYAKNLGVKIKDLIISKPLNGEQAIETAEKFIRTEEVSVIVIDSVSALIPKAEVEAQSGAMLPGGQARLMSQAMRKLAGIASVSKTTVIFINQIRMKIGIQWGSPETRSGGQALKYFASVIIDVRKVSGGKIEEGKEIVGNRVKCRIVKNKVSAPFRETEFDIIYGKGISKVGEIIDYGVSLGLIEKGGAWFKYKEEKAHGRDGFIALLEKNQKMSDEIEKEIRKALV
jgi:recombination protein RecA